MFINKNILLKNWYIIIVLYREIKRPTNNTSLFFHIISTRANNPLHLTPDIRSIFLCDYNARRWLFCFGHTSSDVKTSPTYRAWKVDSTRLQPPVGSRGRVFSSTQRLPLTFLGGGCMLRRVFPAAPGAEEEVRAEFCSHLPSLTRGSPSMRTHPTHARTHVVHHSRARTLLISCPPEAAVAGGSASLIDRPIPTSW